MSLQPMNDNTKQNNPDICSKIRVENFSAGYSKSLVLKNINLTINKNERLAIIGPAGSGKSTFLKSLNRLNDLNKEFFYNGKIFLDGVDIYSPQTDIPLLRRSVGIVYAVPAPLPGSIRANIAFGPKMAGIKDKARIEALIETSLKAAFLWEEVKDRLDTPAFNLSGGQQQRLCLARVLALKPQVLLLDEPCSGLDPISTAKIEEALAELKSQYSIVLVTNNIKQAARASDRTAFFLMGELVECDLTSKIFTNPSDQRTNDYVTGRFG